MERKLLFILVMLVLLPTAALRAVESGDLGQKAQAFVGQDLHLAGGHLISYRLSASAHSLVFQDGFSMLMGANQFSCDSAVVWLESVIRQGRQFRNWDRIDYEATVYLQGNISLKKTKSAKTTDISQFPIKPGMIEEGQALAVRFIVSGEVFVTADKREIADPRGLELYAKAFAAAGPAGPEFKPIPEALPPKPPVEKIKPEKPAKEVVPVKPEEKEPRFRYPINLAPAGEVAPQMEWDRTAKIGIVIGRFYLWQKQDEAGRLLELQADNGVVFYSGEEPQSGEEQNRAEALLAQGAVEAVYLSGNVVMSEGLRTIRADEVYYDFQKKKALAINAVMRSFDTRRGIPIYVRAAKMRQLAENKFAGENVTLTSSEFWQPQISLDASKVIITDTTTVDEQLGKVSDSSYEAEMHDVRFKLYDRTIFYWPFVRSNLQRPDVPLKSIHSGHDSDWGAFVETRWYLARLLGLREPEGTDSTYALDYYGKRGVGTGAEIEYVREDYFGRLLGYVIQDTGEDDLGRYYERRNLKPPRELRGRFRWRHRHFLPYNWQLTNEVSYASDQHFIEGYYRNEFNVGKEQETLIHLKRIEDNWGLSFLGKGRINDFVNKLEELPTAEFHLKGQSFLDDKLTFYSDSQVSRFRQRIASESVSTHPEQPFTFMSERAEVDMPMAIGKIKVVPFAAGTLGYEDQLGFYTDVTGGAKSSDDKVWIAETGARVFPRAYWKVYPNIKSRLWDLNQLRHIIEPRLTAVFYTQSDSVAEQRDVLNIGISQRLQTKRVRSSGNQLISQSGGQEPDSLPHETVDWMRLDMEVTWVNNSSDGSVGPDRFIWNKPSIPLLNRYSTAVPLQDRRSSHIFGPRRNYFSADYIWRLSDTTAILSDMNYDLQSGVVQQFNIGFSHLRWANLNYYIGSRYLRRLDNNLGEKGSNAFTFAATYALDPRYMLVFSQLFDFDYGANIRSDIALIRRYHRMYWAFTYSADESLKRQAIVFSIWPQGVPELAIGPRRYIGLSTPAGY